MMALNPMGKSRKAESPYLILTDPRLPGWEWRVLKAYTMTPDKPYSRWFCVVTSPYTGSYGDMGDTYISDCGPTIEFRDPAVTDECLPKRMRSAR
jgi:hypothetical protein